MRGSLHGVLQIVTSRDIDNFWNGSCSRTCAVRCRAARSALRRNHELSNHSNRLSLRECTTQEVLHSYRVLSQNAPGTTDSNALVRWRGVCGRVLQALASFAFPGASPSNSHLSSVAPLNQPGSFCMHKLRFVQMALGLSFPHRKQASNRKNRTSNVHGR